MDYLVHPQRRELIHQQVTHLFNTKGDDESKGCEGSRLEGMRREVIYSREVLKPIMARENL